MSDSSQPAPLRKPTSREEPDAILEVSRLTKRFGGITAVSNLSLTVPRGSLFGVMGPNGAGKSTLMNLVTGLAKPDTGSIRVDHVDAHDAAPHAIARRGVARTYQNVRLLPGLSVLENVTAGAYRHRRHGLVRAAIYSRAERAERTRCAQESMVMLEKVGLDVDPSRPADTLPYGSQRRVELARALITRPNLLLLDEPTAGMNSNESMALGRLFRELVSTGLSLVLIEHNIELIVELCDRAAVMNFGELLYEGTPAACIEEESVRDAYFGKDSDAHRIRSLLKLRRD